MYNESYKTVKNNQPEVAYLKYIRNMETCRKGME